MCIRDRCVGHGLRTASVRHIVQITFGIGLLIVDGGRRKLVMQGQRCKYGFNTACTAQQMTGHALGAHHGQLLCVFAEHRMDGGGLAGIVHVGAGAVGVDVIHLLRGNACICLLYTSLEVKSLRQKEAAFLLLGIAALVSTRMPIPASSASRCSCSC